MSHYYITDDQIYKIQELASIGDLEGVSIILEDIINKQLLPSDKFLF